MKSNANLKGVAMASKESSDAERAGADSTAEPGWEQIRDCLRGLRFGAVHIVVQDGVIVQIERIEKRRLRTPAERRK